MKAGDRVKVFQSTPPVRGATVDSMSDPYAWIISIHAPRAGGDGREKRAAAYIQISIHAPRAGGDWLRRL